MEWRAAAAATAAAAAAAVVAAAARAAATAAATATVTSTFPLQHQQFMQQQQMSGIGRLVVGWSAGERHLVWDAFRFCQSSYICGRRRKQPCLPRDLIRDAELMVATSATRTNFVIKLVDLLSRVASSMFYFQCPASNSTGRLALQMATGGHSDQCEIFSDTNSFKCSIS